MTPEIIASIAGGITGFIMACAFVIHVTLPEYRKLKEENIRLQSELYL